MLGPVSRLTCLLPLAVGLLGYAVFGHPLLPIAQLELAGTANRAVDIVDGRAADFRDGLMADWAAVIPGYVLSIVLAAPRLASRRLAMVAGIVAVVAGACDVVENVWLWRGLTDPTDHSFGLATAFATIKFVLLVPAAVIAVLALVRPAARMPVPAAG